MKLPIAAAQALCADFKPGLLPGGVHTTCAKMNIGGTCRLTTSIDGIKTAVHPICPIRAADLGSGVRIDFTALELWALKKIAQERQKTAESVDAKWNYARSWVRTWYDGLRGEYAVAKHLGVDLDMDYHAGSGPPVDLAWRGITVETKQLQNWLTFVKAADFKADVAVLVHQLYDTESVTLVGWITRQDFLANCFYWNFGYGKRPCTLPEDLRPMTELWTAYP